MTPDLTLVQAVQAVLDTLSLNTAIKPNGHRSVTIRAGHASGILVRELDKAVNSQYSGLLHCNVRIGKDGVVTVSDR